MFNFFSKKPKVVLSPIIEDTIQRLGTPFGSRICNAHTDSSDYDYFLIIVTYRLLLTFLKIKILSIK